MVLIGVCIWERGGDVHLKERGKVLRRLQPGALRSLATEVSSFLALSSFFNGGN